MDKKGKVVCDQKARLGLRPKKRSNGHLPPPTSPVNRKMYLVTPVQKQKMEGEIKKLEALNEATIDQSNDRVQGNPDDVRKLWYKTVDELLTMYHEDDQYGPKIHPCWLDLLSEMRIENWREKFARNSLLALKKKKPVKVGSGQIKNEKQ